MKDRPGKKDGVKEARRKDGGKLTQQAQKGGHAML
jgi:hypothetical protein